MGKKDAPPPPDYAGAAREQAAASERITREQTYANRPNQTTPFGSSVWNVNYSGGYPRWSQTITLDPDMEAALNDQQAITRGRSSIARELLGDSTGSFQGGVDFEGATPYSSVTAPGGRRVLDLDPGTYSIGEMPAAGDPVRSRALQESLDFSGAPAVGDPNAIRTRAEDAAYQTQTRYLDPQWEQRTADTEVALRNQGLRPGDEAYDRAMGNLEREREAAYGQARRDAFMAGGAESDRLFGQGLSARQQAVSEALTSGTFGNQAALGAFGMDLSSSGYADSARDRAVREALGVAGFEEGTRGADFNRDMGAAGFNNALRQSEIAEGMMRRGYRINEINAILTGNQVGMPTMPNFMGASKAETPQYLRAAESQYGADLDAFNAEQGAWQGLLSGVTGLVPFIPGVN